MAIETKDELLQALETLDTATDEELANLLQQIETAEAAIESAGSEYDAQIQAAEADAGEALGQYNALQQTASAKQQSAATAAEAVAAADATDEIAAIGDITAPTVASNDPAEINAALASMALSVSEQLDLVKAAATALNNPEAVEGLKTAATDLAASNAAIITGAMPPAEDTQPEIDQTFSLIDGLV